MPLYTTIKLLDGEIIHLGPTLTTPTANHLKRTPDILVSTLEDKLVITHRDNEREGEDGEEEEGDNEEAVDVKENNNKEEEEEAEDQAEDTDEDEDEEERKEEIKKAKKPWKDEDVDKQRQEEKRKRQQVHVSYSAESVTTEELTVHFSQYGEVKEVYIVPPHMNYAVITFKSDVVSEFLVSTSGQPGREEGERTHTLQRPGQVGGVDGYGDIRKICFMCPDYAAILSYSLSLGPSHLSLSLNDSPVPGHILATLQEREQSKGTLSFLYQIISL